MEVASRLFLLLLAALLVYALPTVNPQDNAEGTSKPPFRAKSAANPMFSQKQRLSLRYNKAKRQMQMASARLSAKQKGAQVDSSRPCRAMEERLTPGGPCAKAKSLPYWCLPHFNSMNAVELIRSANRYITGLGKAKYKYLTKILKNYTELGSEDGFQEMHWVQNKLNGLGMYTYDHKDFPLWTKPHEFPWVDLPMQYNFTTCAVVGSSKHMLAIPRGEEIDSHNVIFRSNQAPTTGYQRYVGSRTEFRMVNPANGYFSEDGNKTTCLNPLIPVRMGDYVVKAVHGKIPRRKDWCRQVPVSPQFEAYRWTTLERFAKTGAKAKMSSGFAAIAMAVQLCETVDIYGYSFTGNYYFPKVHNGSPVDKATGKMKKGLPKGHLVIYKAPKVPKDAGWGLPHQENEDQYGSQLQVEQEPEYGRGGKRRLQAIAARGHPWDAEKACTARLSQLPTITWHQEKFVDSPDS